MLVLAGLVVVGRFPPSSPCAGVVVVLALQRDSRLAMGHSSRGGMPSEAGTEFICACNCSPVKGGGTPSAPLMYRWATKPLYWLAICSRATSASSPFPTRAIRVGCPWRSFGPSGKVICQ